MTAYIFDLRNPESRLLIASDTLGYVPHNPPKPLGFCPKIIPFPHLSAALCGRGMMQILYSAAAHLMQRPSITTFADVLEELPPILRQITEEYAEQQGIADPDSLLLFEALWCGWNHADKRMEVVAFRNYDGFKPVRNPTDRRMAAVPTLPQDYVPAGLAGQPAEKTMIALMLAMRRYLQENPEVVPAIIGGEITLTEITPRSVSSRQVYRFPDFDQVRIAASAVRARIARGDDDIDVESGLCRVDDAVSENAVPADAQRRRVEKLARRAARAHGKVA